MLFLLSALVGFVVGFALSLIVAFMMFIGLVDGLLSDK